MIKIRIKDESGETKPFSTPDKKEEKRKREEKQETSPILEKTRRREPLAGKIKKLLPSKKLELGQAGRLILLGLVFLLPLYFGWGLSGNTELNKQFILVFFSFTALALWVLRGLVQNKIEVKLSLVYFFSVLFLIFLFLSSVFAKWQWGSLWGWPQEGSQNFLTFASLFLFSFSLAHLFPKNKIKSVSRVILVSGLIVALIGMLQLFGKFILPWAYTRSTDFNTIGNINRWALFLGALIPISLAMGAKAEKKGVKAISYFSVLFFSLSLFLVN